MKLSIVIPTYNSSKIIQTLVKDIKFNLCKKLNNRFEIIFINDCSTDNTWSIIQKITKKYSFVKGIDLKKNVGQHAAIFVGLKYCSWKKNNSYG